MATPEFSSAMELTAYVVGRPDLKSIPGTTDLSVTADDNPCGDSPKLDGLFRIASQSTDFGNPAHRLAISEWLICAADELGVDRP